MTKLADVLELHDAELDNVLDELRARIMDEPKELDIMIHARLMFTYNVLHAHAVGFDILESGIVKSAITQMIDVCDAVDMGNLLGGNEPDQIIGKIGDLMNNLATAYNDTIDELKSSK